jgi:hypothetical protein
MVAYLVLSDFTRNINVHTRGEVTDHRVREQYLLFLEELLVRRRRKDRVYCHGLLEVRATGTSNVAGKHHVFGLVLRDSCLCSVHRSNC